MVTNLLKEITGILLGKEGGGTLEAIWCGDRGDFPLGLGLLLAWLLGQDLGPFGICRPRRFAMRSIEGAKEGAVIMEKKRAR